MMKNSQKGKTCSYSCKEYINVMKNTIRKFLFYTIDENEWNIIVSVQWLLTRFEW